MTTVDPEGVREGQAKLPRSRRVRARAFAGIFTTAATGSLSQVLFSASSLLATAAIVKNFVQVASILVIASSIQLAFVAVARGLTYATLTTTYHADLLQRHEFRIAVARYLLVALGAGVTAAAIPLSLGAPLDVAGAVGIWAGSGVLADGGRLLAIAFSRRPPWALVIGLVHTLLTACFTLVDAGLDISETFLVLACLNAGFALVAGVDVAVSCRPGRDGAYWRSARSLSLSLASEMLLFAAAATVVPIVLALHQPDLAVANQVANQAVTTPVVFALSGLALPLTRRISRAIRENASPWPYVLTWATLLAGGLLLAILAAIAFGSQIGASIFGPTWHRSQSILPYVGLYVGYFAIVQAWLQPWRLWIKPRTVGLSSVLTGALVHGCVLAGSLLGGFGGFGVGTIIGTLTGTCGWVALSRVWRVDRRQRPTSVAPLEH